MVGSIFELPLAERMAYVEEVRKMAAANVAAMEVQREAKSALEQARNHRAVDERADAKLSGAISMPNDRLAWVLVEIARQLTLQEHQGIKAQQKELVDCMVKVGLYRMEQEREQELVVEAKHKEETPKTSTPPPPPPPPPLEPSHDREEDKELVLLEEGHRAKQAERPQEMALPQPSLSSPSPHATEEVGKEPSLSPLWTEEPGCWWLDLESPETSPLSPEHLPQQQESRQESQASADGKAMVVVEEELDFDKEDMVVVVEDTMDDGGCGSEIERDFKKETGLFLVEELRQQASPTLPPSPAQQQQQAPAMSLTQQQQQQQLPGMVPPSPWPPPLWQGSFGMRYFGVWGDGAEHCEEEGESEWEREGIGVVEYGGETWKPSGEIGAKGWSGVLVMSWGEEPPGRRLTKPKRERERERFKITRRLQDTASCSQKARILLFFAIFVLVGSGV